MVQPLLPFLFVLSVLIVLLLVCLIQSKKIKELEIHIEELEETLAQKEI